MAAWFENMSNTEKMNLIYFGYAFVIYLTMLVLPDSPVPIRVGDTLIGSLLTKIVTPLPSAHGRDGS